MKNQNSTMQEEKGFFSLLKRKKKVFIAGMAILLLLSMVGCRSASPRAMAAGNYLVTGTGAVALAAKDFEPLGIVFAETAASRRDGRAATFNMLVGEAAEKGADAIINVSISSTGRFFNRTWSGTALAIKYLDTVPGGVNASTDIISTALNMRARGGMARGWF